MGKLQFLVWGPEGMPIEAFASLVMGELVPRLDTSGAARLKLTLTVEPPPRATVIPFQNRGLALISLWDEAEKVPSWAATVSGAARGVGERVAGYRVTEALPAKYDLELSDGLVTPGVGLLTLLERKAGLSDEDFFRRWYGGHTPLTLVTHPVWCYNRNEVVEPLIEGSWPLDGIVEEHFRRPADLLNPAIFFGGPWRAEGAVLRGIPRMVPNMIKVACDVGGFLNVSTLESYFVQERWIRA